MKNGDRVHTPHGPGTVVDEHERVSDSLRNPLLKVGTGRIGVNLDDGHTWYFKGETAYYLPKELEPE